VSEVLLILIAVIIGYPSPLAAIQILWLNLTTDGAPAIALAIEATEPNMMSMGPRRKTEPLVEKVMLTGIAIQTCVLTSVCLLTYIVGLKWRIGHWNGLDRDMTRDEIGHGTDAARTMCIYLIVFAELLRAYGARSMRLSVFQIARNPYMDYGVGSAVAATIFVGYCPGVRNIFSMVDLTGKEWGFVLGMACIPFVVDELTKCVYRYTGFGERPLFVMKASPDSSSSGTEMRRKQSADYDKLETKDSHA